MVCGNILFVGDDPCARVDVLEHVGYKVARCACDAEALGEALGHPVDAVLFQCTPEPPPASVLSTCRALTKAPVLLFADHNACFNPRDFDVIVPNLCNPRDWLSELGGMIARSYDSERSKPPQAASPVLERTRKEMV